MDKNKKIIIGIIIVVIAIIGIVMVSAVLHNNSVEDEGKYTNLNNSSDNSTNKTILNDEEAAKEYLHNYNLSKLEDEKVDSNGDGVIDEKDKTKGELAKENTKLYG
nr:hypothetical protein [Methanobrevibacter arboriphilus]